MLLSVQLWGCAAWRADEQASVAPDPIARAAWGKASLVQFDDRPWHHLPLPGKRATQFDAAHLDGRAAVAVTADASASMVRKTVRVAPTDLGRLQFSWKVPALIPQADMGARDADDAPVRLVLAFDGDRSRFSPKNAMLSELARALTGEEMPYATLMYVWCNARAPGSVIHNPRTDRIRKIVVQSGAAGLGRWQDYERDVRADFVQAFGEEPGALVAVGIMTDSDNTGTRVQAWYGPLQLHSRTAATP
ncbi:DUF3047 domain-containing protein [Pseudorhodoferax sp.]|uniref:DUF3047 domain-containing protein n=1 Tax=Pseudorhodoferax sp. TaxID=1993553 RepID=UPI002DD6AD71|nr:DUF3047 domain-containing protein [Pseudorhodoferax sp.]